MDLDIEYFIEVLWQFSINQSKLAYIALLSVYNFLLSIITLFIDQIELLESLLTPNLNSTMNFFYALPERVATTIDFIINYEKYYEILSTQFNKFNEKTRSDLVNQLYISALSVMVVMFLFVIFYYKYRIYWLKMRNNELEKNPAMSICCICKVENSNVVLEPCHHLCLCLKCYYLMKKNSHGAYVESCPMCRTPVKREIKVFIE